MHRLTTQLKTLNNAKLPRNLQPNKENIIRSEIYTFGDALEEAYAAAVYLRNVYRDGSIKMQLVIAKTKLAPQKTLSIPKLELNAALLGARLINYAADALTKLDWHHPIVSSSHQRSTVCVTVVP